MFLEPKDFGKSPFYHQSPLTQSMDGGSDISKTKRYPPKKCIDILLWMGKKEEALEFLILSCTIEQLARFGSPVGLKI